MLRRMAMKPLLEKFIKLFRKTPDRDARVLPDELATFLAVTMFEQLWRMRKAVRTNPDPSVFAKHNPVHIFLNVLHGLIGQATVAEESPGEASEASEVSKDKETKK